MIPHNTTTSSTCVHIRSLPLFRIESILIHLHAVIRLEAQQANTLCWSLWCVCLKAGNCLIHWLSLLIPHFILNCASISDFIDALVLVALGGVNLPCISRHDIDIGISLSVNSSSKGDQPSTDAKKLII